MDWTDLESFSRPPPRGTSDCADPEASWGHRKNNLLRSQDELFYGYYLSAGIMMPEENGPGRPRARPPRHGVVVPARPGPRLRPRADRDARQPGSRSATSSTTPATPTATPAPGPSRCGPPARSSSRTCTRTTAAPRAPTTAPSSPTATSTARAHPRPLLELGPLARTATREQAADHDRKTAELARYKLGRLTADDDDGYHRVAVPRRHGQDPLPAPPRVDDAWTGTGPRSCSPPEHPQACCAQQTITVPPDVLAKTAQKHDYPSAAWRRSYARRTGAERGFATAKDPATNDISRGWCRLMGLAPLMLFTTTLLVVRNQRILARLERPAGRKPAPRRRRAAPENPQTAPQDPRQRSPPRRHGRPAAARQPPARTAPPSSTSTSTAAAAACPEPAADTQKPPRRHRTPTARQQPGHASLHAGMSDPNVKIGPTET